MTAGLEIPAAIPRRSLRSTPPELAAALRTEALALAIYGDQAIARSGLATLLVEAGIRVVDTAPVAPEVAERAIEPAPDVAIVAGGDDGDELSRRLVELQGIPVVRLLQSATEAADMLAVLASSASGAVCRRCSAERVRQAVGAVARGGLSFDCPHGGGVGGRSTAPLLSPRERSVATELARGLSTEEVAEALFLSPHTVRTHIRNIQRKLGARTRVHAIALAMGAREVSPPGDLSPGSPPRA